MIDGMNESTRRAVEEVKDGIHGRIFQEIVAEYLPINPYPEYKGKPYFSIKYTENGQEFIGYGTYKPEVLSEYLKEYFIPSAKHGKWIFENRTWFHQPLLKCSCCGRRQFVASFDYCPYCGAKMDEEVEG